MIDESIFRSYDIRGVYPDEINEEAAFEIGKAFAEFTKGTIAVGRDVRLSSPAIFESFTKGILTSGQNAIDLGICTTPMLGFAVANKNYQGGAMITASHNPAEFNGIKLIAEKAVQLSKENGIGKIKEIVMSGNVPVAKTPGILEKYDILPEYQAWILEKIGGVKKLKVAIDYGNGVGAISARPILGSLGLDLIELYPEPDGRYPNHQANPAEEKNLEDLKKAISENKADLGIAFDGDADRAIVVDENGQVANAGFLLAAMASCELQNYPGEKVYYDLRFSESVPEAIVKAGGEACKTKVGNPFYKQKLILEGGLMAAEYSGHFMFKENFGLDDGIFLACKVLFWLSKTGKSLSQFVGEFAKGHFVSGEINVATSQGEILISKITDKYQNGGIDSLDGITVKFSDWWFNLRTSNTEPVVRLNIEAQTPELLEEKRQELLDFIHSEEKNG